MEQNERTPAWFHEVVNIERVRPYPPMGPRVFVDDMDLTVGGGRPEVPTKKPRKPRRRKEVTANKFIVLRVSEDLYQKVRASSESTGTDISKWVRQAVLEQLSK